VNEKTLFRSLKASHSLNYELQ